MTERSFGQRRGRDTKEVKMLKALNHTVDFSCPLLKYRIKSIKLLDLKLSVSAQSEHETSCKA